MKAEFTFFGTREYGVSQEIKSIIEVKSGFWIQIFGVETKKWRGKGDILVVDF